MRTIGFLLVVAACSAFFLGFQQPTDDVIVTATPKGYAPAKAIVRTSWEDAIPVAEAPSVPSLPTILVKEVPPPSAIVPAIKVVSAKKWQPARRYAKMRRLTKVSYPLRRGSRSRRR